MRVQGDKRLIIISDSEIENLYSIPNFTEEQRLWYFSLSSPEWDATESFKNIGTKVYFILQLTYFKARSMFFSFNFHDVSEDLRHVMQQYFSKQKFPKKLISKKAQIKSKNRIVEILNYNFYNASRRKELETKASQIAVRGIKPDFIFREILLYLENQRISIPAYSTLQDIIGYAIETEQKRISTIIANHMTKPINQVLVNLLSKDEALYEITALKKPPKDFTHKQICQEMEKHRKIKDIYDFATRILPKLNISKQNIRYYASMAEHYDGRRLREIECEKTNLYLLCFIYYRFQQINDNLIACFLYWAGKYGKEAKEYAKEKVYEHKIESNNDLPKASKLLGFYIDKSIAGEAQFENVRGKAFEIIEKKRIALVQQYLLGVQFDKTQYEWEGAIETFPKIRKNLRPIFLLLNFEGKSDSSFADGIVFLKRYLLSEKRPTLLEASGIPQKLIPNNIKPYLHENHSGKSYVNANKLEIFIYQRIEDKLDSGEIFCPETTEFKSFKTDLVSDEKWKKKAKIIEKLGVPKLSMPIKALLGELEEILETRLVEVNERIKCGENKDVKIEIGKDGKIAKWTLPYKKQEENLNNPIYGQLPQVSIIEVLRFVDEKCGFMEAFTHIQPRYAKKRSDSTSIMACVIADGTSLGTYKMSGLSNLGFKVLFTAEKNFIRLSTLRKTNDIISNAISKLPIFQHWNINKDIIHASADGQKFSTQHHTLKSRYSPKYFGMNQGVVAYTMIANHVPVNTKIIGANEYEGHYVFDILFNNTSNIVPGSLSVDMAGVNQVNFALLDFINRQYAPRYTRINHRENLIRTFRSPYQYRNYLIRPSGRISKKLIVDEWDNMQRIVASLLLGETTQSVIVKKLCSYARKNKTKEALWEYDNIFRSIYLLNLIDDRNIRCDIQRSLNRGEAYHQLRKAVAIANGGKFRGNTEKEIDIWNDCSRLIANCVIFYNAHILSSLLTLNENAYQTESINLIKSLSPVAWEHINFFGWYDFNERKSLIDTEKFAKAVNSSFSIANQDI